LLFIVKAAADKLKRELEEFGFPPKFPVDTNEEKESKSNKSKSKKVLFFQIT